MKSKIFISYAWENNKKDDEIIKSFVQWLAIYLRKWDFIVYLDQFENRPGTDLDNFMKQGINSSRIVLCICTETYLNKMEIPGTGVYNEVVLLKEKSTSPFIIPIIQNEEFQNLPDFFKGKFVSQLDMKTPYSKSNQSPIFELITTLRDENLSIENINAESRIENYYNDVEKIKFFSDTINLMSFEGQIEKKITFRYLMNGKEFKLGIPPMQFITRWSTAGLNSIHSYNCVQNMFRIHNFINFENVTKPSDIKQEDLVPINWAVNLKIGDGIIWINNDNFMAIGKILDVYIDPEDEFNNTVSLHYRILNPVDLTDEFIENSEL